MSLLHSLLFRVCLLPDERSQRRCSPSSDNFADLNPNFNENFVFQVRRQMVGCWDVGKIEGFERYHAVRRRSNHKIWEVGRLEST